MQLTSKITQILNHLEKIEPFNPQNSLDGVRKYYETMSQQLGGKKESVALIEELAIQKENHQIPVRIYRPAGKNTQPSPAIIYIHGGWFISGGYETHDTLVRKLANKTGSVIIFIDYRLAPEYPFPAGLNDCTDGIEWAIKNAESLGIDPDKIGIIGDSAGAALSTAFSVQSGKQIRFQVLIYPAVDNQLNSGSWETYANGPVLTKQGGIEAWNWYLPEEEKSNPLAIPALVKDFKETPPTFIILAEHDPLLDDGKKLSENMKNAGVDLTISFYKEMVHGFMHMGELLEEVQSVVDEIAAFASHNFKSNI